MLKFNSISGPCLLTDGTSSQEPYPGMSLPLGGQRYVITTGSSSHASVSVGGETVNLEPDTIMVVGRGAHKRVGLDRAYDTVKFYAGKIWAAIEEMGEENLDKAVDRVAHNAVVGVRG